MTRRLLFFLFYYMFLAVLGFLIESTYVFIQSGGYLIKLGFTHLCFDSGVYTIGGMVLFYTVLYFYQRLKKPLFNLLGDELYGRQIDKKIHLLDMLIVVFLCLLMVSLEFIVAFVFLKLEVRFYDYSSMYGNILGIICPMISLMWLLVAIFFYFILFPCIYRIRYKIIHTENLKVRKFLPLFVVFVIYLADVISGIYMMIDYYSKHPEMNSEKIYFPWPSHREKLMKIKYYPDKCF